MDRTLISWNVPNMITVPLMAGLGFLIVAVAWQVIRPRLPGASQDQAAA